MNNELIEDLRLARAAFKAIVKSAEKDGCTIHDLVSIADAEIDNLDTAIEKAEGIDSEDILETIRGLSANIKVLLNVIRDPDGGSPLAKMVVMITAESTATRADELVKKYEQS